jgi:hypothetical protein
LSEIQPSNITINSNSGSNQGGSFFDNLLNNVFKWGILLIGIIILIIVGVIVYFVFFSDVVSDVLDFNFPFTNLLFPQITALFTAGGFVARLFKPGVVGGGKSGGLVGGGGGF